MRPNNDEIDNGMAGSRDRIRKWSEISRNITMVGQLGLSLVIPVLFCMFVCYWLNSRAGVGGWIYIPGLILGIGSSCMTAWKTYQTVMKNDGENEEGGKPPKGPSFSRHL